jgi:hypothetical protein
MPINNEGKFSLSEVVRRQIDRDWPAANTDFDLYVQDLIAAGNVIANGLIIRNIEVSDSILTGNVTASTITANTLVLDIITANVFNGLPAANLDLLSTDDLSEGSSNFYFTIPRARTAFSGGLGIAISANGVISAKGDDTGTGMFNSGINLAEALLVTDNFSNIHVFSSEEGSSFIVYSLHATNITDSTAYLTARTIINDGSNTVLFANLMMIPGTSSMELLRKPQVFKPGDQLQFRSFDSSGSASGDRISVMMSYQASTDTNYERQGITLEDDTPSEIFVTSGRTSIVESIRLVNHDPVPNRVSVYWANATDVLFAWIASNISIPAHSSLEICEYPKSLPENYKIMARKA